MGATSRGQLYDAFGNYVRSQRQLAQLTLRQAAELASISNPYLSQIEHGVVLPSIAVINALADALSVSAETLLLQAAGVPPTTTERSTRTEDAIRQDPRLDDGQKRALLAVLTTFLRSPSDSITPEPIPAETSSRTPRRPATARAASPRANPRRRKI